MKNGSWRDNGWGRAILCVLIGIPVVIYIGVVSGHWSPGLAIGVLGPGTVFWISGVWRPRHAAANEPPSEPLRLALEDCTRRLGVPVPAFQIDSSDNGRDIPFVATGRDGTIEISRRLVDLLEQSAIVWLAGSAMLARSGPWFRGWPEATAALAAMTLFGLADRYKNWWLLAPAMVLMALAIVARVRRQYRDCYRRDRLALQALGDEAACRTALEFLEAEARRKTWITDDPPPRRRLRALFGKASI